MSGVCVCVCGVCGMCMCVGGGVLGYTCVHMSLDPELMKFLKSSYSAVYTTLGCSTLTVIITETNTSTFSGTFKRKDCAIADTGLIFTEYQL